MGWERRGKKGRLVYYRKVRVGGKVKSVYCGSGERGRAAEREDLERRQPLSLVKQTEATPPTPESVPQSQPEPESESIREVFERAVGTQGQASDVLHRSTPEAAEGATPQVVEKAPDAAPSPLLDWRKYLAKRQQPSRKYSTFRYRS
jgi:hypothetical protein